MVGALPRVHRRADHTYFGLPDELVVDGND
jgi:hypothetical protein